MRVLQLGRDDWSASCRVPDEIDWTFVDVDDASALGTLTLKRADATIIEALGEHTELRQLDKPVVPYTLLVARDLVAGLDDDAREFFARKVAKFDNLADRQLIVDALPRTYFERQFGQKLEIRKTVMSPFHAADAWYEGNQYLATRVDSGAEFRQLMMWKENILYENHRALELWPEYVRDEGCEIEFVVQLIESGTPDVILFQRTYSEAELAKPIVISHAASGYLSCSVFAKGSGLVKVGPVHYRHSRLGAGDFLPGGRRIVDSRREELFYYFHPGDLTPPLNIYFSGYRPAEGFEGYFMMAGFGHPFLLITDPRLEGGRFYLGSDELEAQLMQTIRELIESLGFRERDVIFSGLSMGSFGALYYGSQFDALAIIAGKPIIDLGHVARRGRLVRPREFLTVLDIVNFWNKADNEHPTTSADDFTRRLVERWNGDPGFGDTKLLMAYMQQDDYDNEAYYTLLGAQTGKSTTVIARGYQGRHNDDSASIVTWFVNQYKRVIDEYAAAR